MVGEGASRLVAPKEISFANLFGFVNTPNDWGEDYWNPKWLSHDFIVLSTKFKLGFTMLLICVSKCAGT